VLRPKFDFSVVGEELAETKLFPSIILKDTPILNNIYQVVVTLKVLQAQHKNYLSLQRDHLVVGYRNETYPFTDISTMRRLAFAVGLRGLFGEDRSSPSCLFLMRLAPLRLVGRGVGGNGLLQVFFRLSLTNAADGELLVACRHFVF
jgi:hypothetical protein